MKSHPTISWRVVGSDGYMREFHDEAEARDVFAQTPPMQHIDSELQKITAYTEVVDRKPRHKNGV